MKTLSEVRQEFPQYKDMPDADLAGALHKKYYSDLPFEDFSARVGLKTAAPKPPPATGMDRANAGITGMNRGIAGIAGLPMDTVENVYNLGKAGFGTAATALGRPDLAPPLTQGTPLGSQWIGKQLERVGINSANPRPDDPVSRGLHAGGTVLGGSMIPGARPLPAFNAAAAATGAATLSDNPLAPAVASMAPATARQIRSDIRSAAVNPQTVQRNIDMFHNAGAGTPSVGQATESTFFRGLENLTARFPGGQNVMRRFGQAQQENMGAGVNTGVSAEAAGRAVETGIRGPGGFLERTQAVWNRLDGELAARVPQGTTLAPTNTTRALADLTTPTPGAENLTGALVNPRLAQIQQSLAADLTAHNGVVPFEALRASRTRIGSMLENSLVSGVPNGELRRVYGALSQDMEAAATAAGAGREFARQNQYYRTRMDRIETVLSRVLGDAKQPEDVFKALMPTDMNQSGKLRAVMRSLPEPERRVVTDAVVTRLGRATPGKQNEVGDVFSSETFLTNWNKLSPGAKSQIFPEAQMRRDMDAISGVSANVREGSKVFANPSGTAGASAPYGLAILAATGNIPAAAGLVGGAYVGSRMLTSPQVVRWLAEARRVDTPNMPAHLTRLATIFNSSKDEQLKSELTEFIQRQEKR